MFGECKKQIEELSQDIVLKVEIYHSHMPGNQKISGDDLQILRKPRLTSKSRNAVDKT